MVALELSIACSGLGARRLHPHHRNLSLLGRHLRVWCFGFNSSTGLAHWCTHQSGPTRPTRSRFGVLSPLSGAKLTVADDSQIFAVCPRCPHWKQYPLYCPFPCFPSPHFSCIKSPDESLSCPPSSSSPSPRPLVPSNSSVPNNLLSVSLTRMSLTRLCPEAPNASHWLGKYIIQHLQLHVIVVCHCLDRSYLT